MVICSNCGFDAEDSKFCPNCGSKVITDNDNSLCPSCGAEVGESKFCPNCGTKIEVEISETFCPNCGENVGNSAFCPSCGTKIGTKTQATLCPNCDKELTDSSNFCPYCGWSKKESESKSISDKVFEADAVISKKIGRTFNKSKSFGKLMDKSAELRLKHTNDEDFIKFYARNEPACLEVYNELEDPFIKSIFIIERQKLGRSEGGEIMAAIYIPTKNMNHNEAKQFYIDILNNIVQEIEDEKNKGIFNQEQFYKRKVKERSLDTISTIHGLKAIRALRK